MEINRYWLQVYINNQNYPNSLVPESGLIIGREEDCDIQVPGHRVSRRHCRIFINEGILWIEDFQSTNGIFVNEEKIDKPYNLLHGDKIRVGDAKFRVISEGVKISLFHQHRYRVLIAACLAIIAAFVLKVLEPKEYTSSYNLAQYDGVILSDPSEAEVWHQGKKIGVTPFKTAKLVSGHYSILLRHYGYQDKVYNFEVPMHNNGALAVMKPILDRADFFEINVLPANVKVYVNGKLHGRTTVDEFGFPKSYFIGPISSEQVDLQLVAENGQTLREKLVIKSNKVRSFKFTIHQVDTLITLNNGKRYEGIRAGSKKDNFVVIIDRNQKRHAFNRKNIKAIRRVYPVRNAAFDFSPNLGDLDRHPDLADTLTDQ
ncbi:MAG: FHA domain-containing protein [Lentisphaeria bacterium]|nr:FHA domain-containing protein [Lentisphaeria bacterium]